MMTLTVLTLFAAGALGGGIAAGLSALIAVGVAALALLAVANGLRMLVNLVTLLQSSGRLGPQARL